MKKQTNTGLLLVFTEGKNEHSLSQGTSRVQARTLLVQLPINQFPFHFIPEHKYHSKHLKRMELVYCSEQRKEASTYLRLRTRARVIHGEK